MQDDIQPEVVAHDMLGLIRQDVKGRHLVLIILLLDLLRGIRMTSVGTELAGADLPITMLPIFFNLEVIHGV